MSAGRVTVAAESRGLAPVRYKYGVQREDLRLAALRTACDDHS
jgi:hypothetical protein